MRHSSSKFNGPQVFDIPTYTDDRGSLSVVENHEQFPFSVKRVYYLYDVPPNTSRGNHAHRELEQIMIAIHGSFTVQLETKSGVESFELTSPTEGLYVPEMAWRELENFNQDAVCLVLASMVYDKDDYVDSYTEFCDMISGDDA